VDDEDSVQFDPVKQKNIFAFADMMYGLVVLFACYFEYRFIVQVWLSPRHTAAVMSVSGSVALQLLTLTPLLAVLKMRLRIGKKLKADEISPSFASDLSAWLVFFLYFTYLTFGLLMTLVPH
jgi:hypothetical protein